MEFQKVEIIFYLTVSMFGIAGGVIRHWRDGINYGFAGNAGRCLSSGLVSFGAIGIWIGHDTDAVTGPFYYLAIAALIGFSSQDLQEKVFNRAIGAVLDKFGLTDKKQGE